MDLLYSLILTFSCLIYLLVPGKSIMYSNSEYCKFGDKEKKKGNRIIHIHNVAEPLI